MGFACSECVCLPQPPRDACWLLFCVERAEHLAAHTQVHRDLERGFRVRQREEYVHVVADEGLGAGLEMLLCSKTSKDMCVPYRLEAV